jgi:hypothetical protein
MRSDRGTARVTRNTFAFVQNFDCACRNANVNLLLYQLVRDAVVVSVSFDVIVDIDSPLAVLCVFVRLRRERLERGPIYFFPRENDAIPQDDVSTRDHSNRLEAHG